MDNFELKDWEDIEKDGGTIGAGINKAIHKLVVAIFNSGSKTSGQLGYVTEKINELNKNLKTANESSDRLTEALNKITFWGVIIAGIGVVVAALNLVLDFIKYLNL